MSEINLDKARQARAESIGDPITVHFGGRDFTLPPEMPFRFADEGNSGNLRGAIEELLGDEAEQFFALDPSLPDIAELIQQASEAYGVAEGEAPASSGSSPSAGKKSRPTSSGSTGSTSE